MSIGWIFWISAYVLAILFIQFRSRKRISPSIWNYPSGTSWVRLAISLSAAMFSLSSMAGVSSVVNVHGPHGLFFIWSGVMGIGFFPFLFSRWWSKLEVVSENEFLALRYARPWAHRLLAFRSFYLGMLIIPLLLALLIKALADVFIEFFPDMDLPWLMISGAMMLLLGLGASFTTKSRTDVLNLLVFIGLLLFALLRFSWGSAEPMTGIPSDALTYEEFTMFELFVFLGIQWWSAELQDGSGMEAQHMLGLNSRRKSLYASWASKMLLLLVGMAVAFLTLFANTRLGVSGDHSYLAALLHLLPEELAPVLLVAFIGLAVSTSESFMSWGSGMLIQAKNEWRESKKKTQIGRWIMFFIMVFALLIAHQLDSILEGVKWLLGVTAGVGSVYLMRWFWWRVNAQAQLAAMLGAYLCVPSAYLLIDLFLPSGSAPSFAHLLCVATVLNILLWTTVAFLTNQEKDHMAYAAFRERLQIHWTSKDALYTAASAVFALSVLLSCYFLLEQFLQ